MLLFCFSFSLSLSLLYRSNLFSLLFLLCYNVMFCYLFHVFFSFPCSISLLPFPHLPLLPFLPSISLSYPSSLVFLPLPILIFFSPSVFLSFLFFSSLHILSLSVSLFPSPVSCPLLPIYPLFLVLLSLSLSSFLVSF